jgi:hypothetical protein
MDCSSTCTRSTTASSTDYQLSSDNDSQTLFDEESIKSIIAQIRTTRVKPQQQLTDILFSYLEAKGYSAQFIDERLNPSFFGSSSQPSAIFQAFGSDIIAKNRRKEQYFNVTFLEVYANRSHAGIGGYKNIYSHIRRTARDMLDEVRERYDLLPKRKTSGEFAQSKVVKIFIAFN